MLPELSFEWFTQEGMSHDIRNKTYIHIQTK